MTRSEATKSTAAEQLVDIRDVKIDRSLPSEERIKSFIEQIKNCFRRARRLPTCQRFSKKATACLKSHALHTLM